MLGGRFLLFALALIVSMATNDLPYCSRSFIPQEWQKEGESYLLNIAEFEQHLQPQPYFFSKLTRLATGSPQSFLELIRTAVAKVLPLNGLYLSICALVLLLMLAFYFSRKKHEFSEIPLFNQLLAEKARTSKYLKLGIVFLLVLAAVFSLKGISEASRQEKAINHILCLIVGTQKFIQKNNTYIANAELQEYINSLAAKNNGDNFVEMIALQKKVRIAEYPQRNVEAIIRALQEQSYQGSMLQQLHDAKKTLSYLAGFMAANFGFFEVDCRQKAFFFLFQVLKYSTVADNLLDAARKGRIKDLQLEELPQNATVMGKACFVTILVIAIAACFLIWKEEDQDKWLVHLGWLRFVLSVIVLVCFITVIVTTLFLSFNLWVYQGGYELSRDPGYCYNTFSVFNNKIYGGVCRLLSPASNQKKYRSSSPFYSDACHNVYDEYNQMARPYLNKNQTYFHDLMASAAQEIRNQTSKHEILEKIESRYSKFPLIPIMKDTEKHLVFSINLEDEIQSQNISIREFFEEFGKIVTTHTGNSAYAIRQICKALSITFILVLLLSNIAKWLAESVTGSRLKEREEFQQSSLNEIDSI